MQVLQVAIGQHSQARSVWTHAQQALPAAAEDGLLPEAGSEESLQSFLAQAGRLLGKDPNQWARQGKATVDYSEKDLIRCSSAVLCQLPRTLARPVPRG